MKKLLLLPFVLAGVVAFSFALPKTPAPVRGCTCPPEQQQQVNLPPVMPEHPTTEDIEEFKRQELLYEQTPEYQEDLKRRERALRRMVPGAIVPFGQAVKPAPESDVKDCVIVAALAYNKLQKGGVWSEIIGIAGLNPEGKPRKHAMVAFQVRPDTSIFIYDIGGAVALETKSRNTKDLERALEEFMTKNKVGKLVKLEVIVPNRTETK